MLPFVPSPACESAKVARELLFQIQHLLLADVASLLIVFGFTGPLLQPLLSFRAGRPLRVLTHPVVAISAFTLNLYIWHLPFMYQAVLTDTSLHVLEHLLFLSTGILLWMPLFGPLPKPEWFGKGAHVIYTVGIWVPSMIMANVFMWSDSIFYPDYTKTAEAVGISAIADQSTSGAILMAECTFLALGIFAWVFLRWAKEDIEKQDLLDLAIDRHFALTSERASRAVELDDIADAARALRCLHYVGADDLDQWREEILFDAICARQEPEGHFGPRRGKGFDEQLRRAFECLWAIAEVNSDSDSRVITLRPP